MSKTQRESTSKPKPIYATDAPGMPAEVGKYNSREFGPKKKGRLSNRKMEARFRRIMFFLEKGLTKEDIAKRLGLENVRSIDTIMSRTYFQEKWGKIIKKPIEEARKIFEENAIEAAQKVVKLSRSGRAKDKLQFDASKEILYQVGLKPVDVVESRKREYTPEEMERMRTTTLEIEQIVQKIGVDGGGSRFVQRVGSEESPALAPVKALTPALEDDSAAEDVNIEEAVKEEDVDGASTTQPASTA